MILNLIDLSKVYAGLDTPILNKINLCLFQGENIAITGVSGSGKSTLLHLMAGLDIPSKGSVEIDNKNLATLNQSQLAVMRNVLIGFVYQAHHLLPDFTALEIERFKKYSDNITSADPKNYERKFNLYWNLTKELPQAASYFERPIKPLDEDYWIDPSNN